MLAIGGAAGAASFTHVHNVAAAHGQPGWLAWADAIVLELMSIASGLELRRRKRAHTSTVFPATVLACAVTLSLAAQVVEAEPSVIGWVAAAVPALGFLVMVKIALGRTSTATPATARTIADRRPDEAGRTRPDSGSDEATRSGVTAGERSSTRTVRPPAARRRSGGRDRRRRADRGRSAQMSGDAAELLPAARDVRDRLAADGQALTRAALAEALRAAGHTVSNTRVSELLKTLKVESSAPPELLVDPVMPTNPMPPPLSPGRRSGGRAVTPAPVDPGGNTPLGPNSHPFYDQENPDHEQPHE
ncbi:DUF2637 domain-containing protein [Micromonospora sp. 4G57]|uniref:DUF2637 domain-containing protein n=2 Tax=Micromonospora TaxID=1873 RepID=A0ABU5JJS8_9ACTN|nr:MULTISPECIES: DUF2637 domain-containing protein [unclassified Micromonospora]MDZ5446085.1 DUF2637 domain-containing protein [Micromonospora sp. 4G57]MDZ5492782.1 DUF2637 domain-containing protein [Micromonospora sp. 4G53]